MLHLTLELQTQKSMVFYMLALTYFPTMQKHQSSQITQMFEDS